MTSTKSKILKGVKKNKNYISNSVDYLKKNIFVILIILTIIFAVSRLFFLNIDPIPIKDVTDISDEAYWGNSAKNAVLYNDWKAGYNQTSVITIQGPATAPLDTALIWISFKFFGVHLWSLRLVSAIAGILTIILVYLILYQYSKKAAIVGAFLLSIDIFFFTLNRIGHVESVTILFITLMLYFLSKKETLLTYALAGLCLALTILSKLVALSMIVIPITYILTEWALKKINYKHVLAFILSFGIILSGAIIFYFAPHYGLFQPVYKQLSGADSVLATPLKMLRIVESSYFSFFTTTLLCVLSCIYFIKRRYISIFTNTKNALRSMHKIEILTFCSFLFFLLSLGVTDITPRRYPFLTIPLIIFSALLLTSNKIPKLDYKKKNLNNIGTWFFIIITILLLGNLFRIPIEKLSSNPAILKTFDFYLKNELVKTVVSYSPYHLIDASILKYTFTAILVGICGAAFILVAYLFMKSRKKEKIIVNLGIISIIFFIFGVIYSSINESINLMNTITSSNLGFITILLITIMIAGSVFFLITKNYGYKVLSCIYITLSVILIILSFTGKPTVYNTSLELKNLCSNNTPILTSHHFSFEIESDGFKTIVFNKEFSEPEANITKLIEKKTIVNNTCVAFIKDIYGQPFPHYELYTENKTNKTIPHYELYAENKTIVINELKEVNLYYFLGKPTAHAYIGYLEIN